MAEAVAERWVKHPAAKVWRALSEPELAAAWLPFDGYRPEVGARFTAVGPSGPASCEVVAVEAPRRVVCTWLEGGASSELTIELIDDVGGTRVVVRHSAPDDARRRQLHGLWLLALQGGLDAVLVGGTATVVAGASSGTGLSIIVGIGAVVVGLVVGAVVSGVGGETPDRGAAVGEVATAEGGPVAEVEAAPEAEPVTAPPERPSEPTPPTFPPLPPMRGGEAVTVYDDLPTTLHPLYPQTEADIRAHRLVWMPLFERSALTGQVRSELVLDSRMEGSTLVVDLEPGHTFHDGHPIAAEDVCFSVAAVLDPSTPTTLPFRGRADLLGCEVRGPLTAAITLRAPLPDAKLRAAVPVLPAHAFDLAVDSEVAQRPVGSGPYRGQRGRRAVRFSALAADAGMPDLVIEEGGDSLVQVRTLLRGGVHGMVEVTPPLRSDVSASDDVLLKTWEPRVLVYLATNPETVSDVALRQRMARGIDRQELVYLTYGLRSGEPMAPPLITGPFLSSSAFTNRSVRPQAVVREAVTSTRKPLRLGYDPEEAVVIRHLAEALGNQLRSAGIPVHTFKASAPDPKAHDLWLGTWQVDPTDDPTPMLQPGPLGARSAAVDAKLTAMRAGKTDTEQQDAAHELHAIVAAEAQWIGLFEDRRTSAWRAEVRGNTITPYSYWAAVADWRVDASAEQ